MVSLEPLAQLAAGSRRIWSIVPDQDELLLGLKVNDCQPLPEIVAVTLRDSEKLLSEVRFQ